MDFLEFPQRLREKSVPQGLKANKPGRLMSGLKPGPTSQQTFPGLFSRAVEVEQSARPYRL
jgi:hypothetical protein